MMTDTEERILAASIQLFSQKGYHSVTTKEIAQRAGVSEMTLFRHFENKRNLYECAYARYNIIPEFKILLQNKLQGDIEKDLLVISKCYQEALNKNQTMILMQFRNGDMSSEDNLLIRFPRELVKLLTDYFAGLKEQKVIKGDPQVLSVDFLAGNFGLFITFLINKTLSRKMDFDSCLQTYVQVFAHGIMEKAC